MNDVTRILSELAQGDAQAAGQLLPLVYDELRKLAAARMADEAPGNTLDATALVHEAYLRLVGPEDAARWDNRAKVHSNSAKDSHDQENALTHDCATAARRATAAGLSDWPSRSKARPMSSAKRFDLAGLRGSGGDLRAHEPFQRPYPLLAPYPLQPQAISGPGRVREAR
jgi:hypothetical protein